MTFGIILSIISALVLIFTLINKRRMDGKVDLLQKQIGRKDAEIRKQSDDLTLLYKQLRGASKNTEEEIKRSLDRLTIQNKKIIDHTYFYSNQMRQPLERIRGYVLLLQLEDFTQKPSQVIESLNTSVEELDRRLSDLTEKLNF